MHNIKIHDVKVLIDKYGDIKLSILIERIKGDNPYKCPKCDGKGYTSKMVDMYPKGLPDSGWVVDYKEIKSDCDLCNGIGYTKIEYKPKVEIIGYERV